MAPRDHEDRSDSRAGPARGTVTHTKVGLGRPKWAVARISPRTTEHARPKLAAAARYAAGQLARLPSRKRRTNVAQCARTTGNHGPPHHGTPAVRRRWDQSRAAVLAVASTRHGAAQTSVPASMLPTAHRLSRPNDIVMAIRARSERHGGARRWLPIGWFWSAAEGYMVRCWANQSAASPPASSKSLV